MKRGWVACGLGGVRSGWRMLRMLMIGLADSLIGFNDSLQCGTVDCSLRAGYDRNIALLIMLGNEENIYRLHLQKPLNPFLLFPPCLFVAACYPVDSHYHSPY